MQAWLVSQRVNRQLVDLTTSKELLYNALVIAIVVIVPMLKHVYKIKPFLL